MHKKLLHLTLLVLIAGLTSVSCSNNSTDTSETTKTAELEQSSVNVPQLLARSGKVGSEREANKMFNTSQTFKTELQDNPENYEARLKMADLYIVEARATGNYGYYYPAAVKMIDAVLEENPKDKDDKFRALTSKAVILLSYHKFEEAREMGRQALAVNPHNSRVYGILTDANVEMGDYEQAVTMADSMVAIRPDLRSYSRVSYLREIFGDVAGAKAAMKMAITAGAPGHEETTWSRVTLGNIHENYGELDSAEFQYNKALAGREGYPFALKGLASIEAKRGNYDVAEKLLKQALENREDASFYEEMAELYAVAERPEDMREARKKAFASLRDLSGEDDHQHEEGNHSHGADGHHHENNGHSHNEGAGHHHHDSEKDHHHSEDHKGGHGHSHEVGLEMANLYLALTDEYEKALDNALYEFERRPANLDVNKTLAHAYLKLGNLYKAAEHLKMAESTRTEDPQLKLISGLVKIGMGQREEGRKLIRKSFDMNPYQNNELAREARQALNEKPIKA